MLSTDSAQIENSNTLQVAGALCGSLPTNISQILTLRLMQTGSQRKSTYKVPLSIRDATFARNTLAKLVYNRLFDWILERINKNLRPDSMNDSQNLHIRILDIFGFENFAENSLEQVVINFANEKLQSQFNVMMFSLEQKAYQEEGVKWTSINVIDNSDVVDFFEKKGNFFFMLDEEARVPQGSDEKLLQKLENNFKSKPFWKTNFSKGSSAAGKFCIAHYAGEVIYSVQGFLQKNQGEILKSHRSELMNDLTFL